MLKKIVLLATIALLPLGAFAQDKIAYFNPAEIAVIMPEYKLMQDSLQKTQEAIQTEMNILKDEYNKKYQAFMNESEGLIESIKIRRMQEIQDIEQRAAAYSEQSQQDLIQIRDSLLGPVQQRIREAVQAVGKANNFTYILDASVLLYIATEAIDATPLVQKQLGL
jgi:outer membrane protein